MTDTATTDQIHDRGEVVPIDTVAPDPRNPNQHGPKNLDAIEGSLREHGQRSPLVVHNGVVVAGNGRLEVMRDRLGWTHLWINRCDDMSYPQARRYALQDNRTGELAEWDLDVLAEELGGQAEEGVDLGELGWDEQDLGFLLHAGPDGEGDGDDQDPSDGSLLALSDISVGEPKHEVETGDEWVVGDRHLLFVADVMKHHVAWRGRLDDDDLFVPYPTPYVPLSRKAEAVRLVMVQPDRYVAGHLLDKYTAIHGAGSVRKVEA